MRKKNRIKCLWGCWCCRGQNRLNKNGGGAGRYSVLGGGGHWQITRTVMFGVPLSFSAAQRKYNKSR